MSPRSPQLSSALCVPVLEAPGSSAADPGGQGCDEAVALTPRKVPSRTSLSAAVDHPHILDVPHGKWMLSVRCESIHAWNQAVSSAGTSWGLQQSSSSTDVTLSSASSARWVRQRFHQEGLGLAFSHVILLWRRGGEKQAFPMPQRELWLPLGNSFYLTNRKHSGLSSHSQGKLAPVLLQMLLQTKLVIANPLNSSSPFPLEGTRCGTGWMRG